MRKLSSSRESEWDLEVSSGSRFEFGKNWQKFLQELTLDKISRAQDSLSEFFGAEDLREKTFVDVGCGSGIFSLAARNLGAKVVSFDYDKVSVACTQSLRDRFYPADQFWQVHQGSVLDSKFIQGIGSFDLIYSWGVLHHTGDLSTAFSNVLKLAGKSSLIFVAIYNHQKYASRYWTVVKKNWVRFPIIRPLLFSVHLIYPGLPSAVLRLLERRKRERGMSFTSDLVDWLGGYPFETAKPEEVITRFFRGGFVLANFRGVGGRSGCNEYLFEKRVDSLG